MQAFYGEKPFGDSAENTPSAVLLRFPRHCDVRQVRLVPLESRALHLEHFERNHISGLFAVESYGDLLWNPSLLKKCMGVEMISS